MTFIQGFICFYIFEILTTLAYDTRELMLGDAIQEMLSYLACSHHCPFEERTPHNHINAGSARAHLNSSLLKLEFFRFLGVANLVLLGHNKMLETSISA